jgi:ribosomal protein S27E
MGYVFEENGKLYLVRCPECGRENYGPAVSSGQCCWCGRIAKSTDVDPVVIEEIK